MVNIQRNFFKNRYRNSPQNFEPGDASPIPPGGDAHGGIAVTHQCHHRTSVVGIIAATMMPDEADEDSSFLDEAMAPIRVSLPPINVIAGIIAAAAAAPNMARFDSPLPHMLSPFVHNYLAFSIT